MMKYNDYVATKYIDNWEIAVEEEYKNEEL